MSILFIPSIMVGFLGAMIFGIAMLTYVERKVLAAAQLRWGANVVGPFGLLQPFADGIKLIFKEPIIPQGAHTFLFLFAPVLTFGLALSAWVFIPWSETLYFVNAELGLLALFVISSLSVYGVTLGGWASNSKYALFGGLRAAAQMISYEVALGLVLMSIVLTAGSLNLKEIVLAQKSCWFVFLHFPMFVLFLIIILAETKRAPFDMAEAESELAGGYNVEYSSTPFAAFFLAEYGNMILMSTITALVFLGGWLPPLDIWPLNIVPGPLWLGLKIDIILFIFLWVRASLPRYRYDQLMHIGWKVCLPISLGWFVLTATFLFITDGFPG